MKLYSYSPLSLRGVNKDNFYIGLFLRVLPSVTFFLKVLPIVTFFLKVLPSVTFFKVLPSVTFLS